MSEDPFGTAGIRARVLAAWTASPARFREDANAEQDLTHGAYRDRLLVELAQNAADAALRGGVPGALRLSLVDGELRAANTGAPLDPAGAGALATLRASAKRDGGSVGRFGVGFAAVLTVTDEPVVLSRAGGVRFSAADTRALVEAVPVLAAELGRRRGQVPVLRLPFPAAEPPPPGYDTEVRLPLRPGVDLGPALAELDPVLLLALPALRSIDAAGRLLTRHDLPTATAPGPGGAGSGTVLLRDGDRESRWVVRSAAGTLPADLLAGLPAEAQDRPEWTVTWAVPVDAAGAPARPRTRPVVHAPTPTDEPLSVPAVLLGSFPLGSDRRHVIPGPVTDLLVATAAGLYAEAVAALPPTPALLALVPRPQLAAAELDAAVAAAVLTALRTTPWLPTAAPDPDPPDAAAGDAWAPAGASAGTAAPGSAASAGTAVAGSAAPAGTAVAGSAAPAGTAVAGSAAAVGTAVASPAAAVGAGVAGAGGRVRPGEAVVVDAASAELVAALADLLPGLLPADWSGRGHAAALTALGVRRLSTAEVVELVAGVVRAPAWWHALYAALETAEREALSGLPVPLADGRTLTGARGVLLPDADLPADAAGALGLRVVHPDAAHPLLERLGAIPATARGVLADDRVLAAVAESYDEEDPQPVADAVLALVAGARPAPGEVPELAELALPAADGEWYPAGELLLPGSPLAAVVDEDAPFGVVRSDLVERWGPDVLAAVGVLRTFAVLRAGETDLDPDAAEHDLDGEADWMEAVLDRLPPQRTPPRLTALVAVRDLDLVVDWAGALPLLTGVDPTATVRLADGTHTEVPSYTTWWLSTHRTLGGARPDQLRTPEATDLAGLYDPAPGDSGLLALTGVPTGLDDVLADLDRALDLLDRLGDPARTAPAATLGTVYARLALVLADSVEPPERVRVAPDRTVPRERAVVLDRPYLLPLLSDREPVPAAGAPGPVADLLDLPLAGELVKPPQSGPVRTVPWEEVPGAGLAAARCGAAVPTAAVAVHRNPELPWWPDGDTDHTDGTPDALGRALAWRLDAWSHRAAAAEAIAHPDRTDALRAEDALA